MVAPDRAGLMAQTMAKAEWTVEEIALVNDVIYNNAELAQIIGFERTIGPQVFGKAREHPLLAECRLFTDRESEEWSKKHGEKAEFGRVAWMQYRGDHFEAVRVENEDERFWRFFRNVKRRKS